MDVSQQYTILNDDIFPTFPPSGIPFLLSSLPTKKIKKMPRNGAFFITELSETNSNHRSTGIKSVLLWGNGLGSWSSSRG